MYVLDKGIRRSALAAEFLRNVYRGPDSVARTHGCVRSDSETHETVLLDCTTGEAGIATQWHKSSAFHCYFTVEMTLVWLVWYTLRYIYFKFAISFITLMNLGETWLGDGVADDAVDLLLPLWLNAAALWRHTVSIRIVTSHNSWTGYEYSLPNLNRPRAIHKHNHRPLETMGCVW